MEAKHQTQTNVNVQCPVCSATGLEEVLELRQLPVLANVLWDSREQALAAPRGDVCLIFCERCGHVFNQAFDPGKIQYNVQYENSLHFSPRFQQHAIWLAHHLVDEYSLHGKTIVEIGSGKGDFLRLLCEYGGNVGTGFDPSYEPNAEEAHPFMSFIRDVYSEQYADYQADLICSRHTLEHMENPTGFVQSLRSTIGNHKRSVVFIEVPNFGYILRDTAIWDIIYEHYSYFSPHSLSNLFSFHGFNILTLADAYDGQFLYIEAIPRDVTRSAPNAPYALPLETLIQQVKQFEKRSQEKLQQWRQIIDSLRSGGKRTVLWGAGSKGISMLNMLHVQDEIGYIVDINPRKRNRFVTGAGQQIVAPEFLLEYRPDTIIIMNPIYQQEIQQMVDEMGLQVEFMAAS